MKNISNIFLTYANINPKDDPSSFFTLLEVIKKADSNLWCTELVEGIVNALIAFHGMSENKAKMILKDISREEAVDLFDINGREYQAAFSATYGACREDENTLCPQFEELYEWAKPMDAVNRPRCYECDHRDFVHSLEVIRATNNYKYFSMFLSQYVQARNRILCKVSSLNEKFPDSDKEPLLVEIPQFKYCVDVSFEVTFNDFIRGIVGFSFTEFLAQSQDSRHKIKLCPYCNHYFIQNRKDQTYCKETCRKNKWIKDDGYLKRNRVAGNYIHRKDRQH